MNQHDYQPNLLRALLIFVAYHPHITEVKLLSECLKTLPSDIGYAIISNDHRAGDAVEALMPQAKLFLSNHHNPGYGRAVNQLVNELEKRGPMPEFLGILNTDLAWGEGTFSTLINWLECNEGVVLAVPQIINCHGQIQKLCKQNPTILALLSRRFFSDRIKPNWLRKYDKWYEMDDRDYQTCFDSPYLSGCCMIMRYKAFNQIGGFDENFFLYLEDADITRRMATLGRAIHLPIVTIVHNWGRGNHRNIWLTIVNIHSAWIYFHKWGIKLK